MSIRFWMDTDDGREVEVVAQFPNGTFDGLDVFDHGKPHVLSEKEFDHAEYLAVAAYELGIWDDME